MIPLLSLQGKVSFAMLCFTHSVVDVRMQAMSEAGAKGITPKSELATDCPSVPSTWDIIGPFPAGQREIDADPLDAWGGIDGITRAEAGATYPSETADYGVVSWSTVNTTTGGVVLIDWSSTTDWSIMDDFVGFSSELVQGWALGDFQVTTAQVVMVTCRGISLYYIDDLPITGDGYGEGFPWIPVSLSVGTHTFKACSFLPLVHNT